MSRCIGSVVLVCVLIAGLPFREPRLLAQQTQAPGRTMLEMTFPEFEDAVKKSDLLLLPIGAIEEHGPALPLATDAITATSQFLEVQRYLHERDVESIVGPALNIGLTHEDADFAPAGTFIYPGSLTVRLDTMVALYVDVLRSLRYHGIRRVFLFSGHGGINQQRALMRIADEATRTVDGMRAYALVPSENVGRTATEKPPSTLTLENYRNHELLGRMLGIGVEAPSTMHADGAEISLMLFYRPDMVRSGYAQLPQTASSVFLSAGRSGNRAENPTGMGGYPPAKASAEVGKTIIEYRTAIMGDTILRVLRAQP